MRASGLLYTATLIACLGPSTSLAETPTTHRAAVSAPAEEQTEPFHKHRDTRHGHDHYYPDRGAIVRDLPVGTIGTSYAGVSYRYHDGIWLEPRGPAYMVVAPPIGLVAPTLPLYSTVVTHGSDSYLYCNDTYYRPRPDLGGYEVVNDPTLEAAPPAAPDALVGGAMPSAPAAVGAGAAGAGAGAAGAGAGAGAAVAASPSLAAATSPSGAVVPAAAVVREPGLAGGAMPGVAPAGATTPAVGAVPAPATSTAPATAATVAAAGAVAGTPKVPKVFLYPKNGQSADQQAHDRYDCYRFAVAQSGFDPMRTGASVPTPTAEQQSDFDRAQGACFEGRGYSNR